ncbi:unnamed protein product [Sphagnum jensenii]|uniref:Uncharacterized protein n=1 Tax=Sphagnum jensenii TaxID=128206 RepID=A0ABP0VI96_9BRYO
MTDTITIDESLSVTNTLHHKSLSSLIRTTFDHIYAILSDHCGPESGTAMIIQNNEVRNLIDPQYAIFTRDGIKIVQSIDFKSPIQRELKTLVAYIGTRVDSLSHDGTTTSMMFFLQLVSNCIGLLEEDKTRSVKDFETALVAALKDLARMFDSQVIRIRDLEETFSLTQQEAIRYIAYHQAMMSSRQDRELATAIVDVVETLPKEFYSHYSISQSAVETENRFTVIHDDFDLMLPVVHNLDDMNHAMGTRVFCRVV